MAKRLDILNCSGVVVDVQEFFLEALDASERKRIEHGTARFVTLLSYLQIPLTFTVERPLDVKGDLPESITDCIRENAPAQVLAKDFFDLSREKEITDHLRSLKRNQIVLTGCE